MTEPRTWQAFVREVIKLAEVITPLRPHQQRVVARIQQADQPGLVVAHGLGSGKTLTSIAAQEALGLPAVAVVPASLQENYQKEVRKHVRPEPGRPAPRTESLQRVAVRGEAPPAPLLIIDEAHRLRDPSSKSHSALKKNQAEKRLLLTASPFYNSPADIAPLINLAAGATVLPGNRKEFEQRYTVDQRVAPNLWGRLRGVQAGAVPALHPRRKDELRTHFDQWVDYHPPSTEGFPTVSREDIRVPMTQKQLKVYDTLIHQAPSWVRYKVRKGLPPSKQEAKQLNAVMTGLRQASNSTAPYITADTAEEPKIEAAVTNLKKVLESDPTSKAVIYSNYLESGIDPYKRRLEASGIPYGEFTGRMKKPERDQLIRDFNDGKIKALLLSSAGGEGLDLKGTRLIQTLEPHWNLEKIRQVEGRGIRYKSHAHLPPEKQTVHIERYLATRTPKDLLEKVKLRSPGGSVDEYLADRSQEKEDLIRQFRTLLAPTEKHAASIPGMKVPGVKSPTAGGALGALQNGGIRPPTAPKLGVSVPRVV